MWCRGLVRRYRAINDHPDINPATKKQIQETIEQYGYIPNNSARNLKRTESNAVAILVKGITNPLFSSMIQVLDEKLKRFKFVSTAACQL